MCVCVCGGGVYRVVTRLIGDLDRGLILTSQADPMILKNGMGSHAMDAPTRIHA